jgi:hypothetical protein
MVLSVAWFRVEIHGMHWLLMAQPRRRHGSMKFFKDSGGDLPGTGVTQK